MVMDPEQIEREKAYRDMGLTDEEYEKIKKLLNRRPNYTETGIFSVMWSEHCSYKSSKPLLKKFPTKGPHVLIGPGEGAGCALPRAMAELWPRSRHLVAEIDAKLAEYVRSWFDLPRAPRLRIRTSDAREALQSLRTGGGDAIIRDTFAGGNVPPHLRTLEFTRLVADRLADTGCYLLNLADNPPLPVARREAATVAQVFEHTAVIAEPGVLRGRRYGNVVIIAAHDPWPVAELNRELRTLAPTARLLHGAQLQDFIGTARTFRDPDDERHWYAGREPTDASESAEERVASMLPDTREDPDRIINLY